MKGHFVCKLYHHDQGENESPQFEGEEPNEPTGS